MEWALVVEPVSGLGRRELGKSYVSGELNGLDDFNELSSTGTELALGLLSITVRNDKAAV